MTAKTSKHAALGALLATPILAAAATASAASPAADQISADPSAVQRLSSGLLGVSPGVKLTIAGHQARANALRATMVLSVSRTSRLCNTNGSNGPALDGLRAHASEVDAVVLPTGETVRVRR